MSAGLQQDPTENNNDFEIRGQTYAKLSSSAYPSIKNSFVLQLSVTSIDFAGNTLLDTLINASFKRIKSIPEDPL